MSEHTPGPWEISTDRGGCEICVIFGMPRRPTDDGEGQGWVYVTGSRDVLYESEQEANANLISAAPDLLEALTDTLFEAVELRISLREYSVRPDGSYDEEFAADIARIDGIIARAQAAIARATGQEAR